MLRTLALCGLVIAAVGCDDAASGGDPPDVLADQGPDRDGPPPDAAVPFDTGPTPDMAAPDAAPTPDAGPAPDMALPDMAVPDMALPDMALPTPGAPGAVVGGAQRQSPRFELSVTVGGTAPAVRQSPRFRTRIGVGQPSLSPPGAP